MSAPSFQSKLNRFHHRKARFWICGCIASTLLACEAKGQYDPDWARHLRIGVLVGFNIKTDFKVGNSLGIPTKPGVFEDGYVIPNPNDPTDDPFTANWGYDNASQYDGGNNTLSMHRATSFTPTGTGTASSDKEEEGPFVGFDMAYGGNLWYWKSMRMRIGWEFGFGFMPIKAEDTSTLVGQVERSIFSFNTDVPGSILDFPDAGYRGTGGDFARLIRSNGTDIGPDVPLSNVTVTGSRTLDVTLYSFRLGPSFFWDINEYIGVSASAGPAVGLVSGSFRFNEQVGDTPSKGSFDASDVLIGGYVNATLTYHAVKNGDFYISVQYMPMGTSTFGGLGRQAQLDLQGAVYLSAGINWPF